MVVPVLSRLFSVAALDRSQLLSILGLAFLPTLMIQMVKAIRDRGRSCKVVKLKVESCKVESGEWASAFPHSLFYAISRTKPMQLFLGGCEAAR